MCHEHLCILKLLKKCQLCARQCSRHSPKEVSKKYNLRLSFPHNTSHRDNFRDPKIFGHFSAEVRTAIAPYHGWPCGHPGIRSSHPSSFILLLKPHVSGRQSHSSKAHFTKFNSDPAPSSVSVVKFRLPELQTDWLLVTVPKTSFSDSINFLGYFTELRGMLYCWDSFWDVRVMAQAQELGDATDMACGGVPALLLVLFSRCSAI